MISSLVSRFVWASFCRRADSLADLFLLCDKPETYNLPPDPVVPTKNLAASWGSMFMAIAGLAALAVGSVLSARSAP